MVKTSLSILISLLVWVNASSSSAAGIHAHLGAFPRVDSDLEEYDQTVANMRTEFAKLPADAHDIEWVKKKLQHMVDVDQYMRRQADLPYKQSYTEAEKEYFEKEYGERFSEVDRQNTRELKELLKLYHWFTISKFSWQADRNAWLLVQHADQVPEFQKQILAILTELYPRNETSPINYAYLYDRVAASYPDPSKRTLQRYGTQGLCTGPGKWEPLPMEEPERVDERRATVGLGTMAEYMESFKNLCH